MQRFVRPTFFFRTSLDEAIELSLKSIRQLAEDEYHRGYQDSLAKAARKQASLKETEEVPVKETELSMLRSKFKFLGD